MENTTRGLRAVNTTLVISLQKYRCKIDGECPGLSPDTPDMPPSPYGSYQAIRQPPGGMGVTSQGFGQEGYQLATDDEGPLPKPPDQALNFSTGVPYFLPFATPYRDSWEVFRDDPVSIRQLQSMRRRDGQARALYRLMTKPLLASLKGAEVLPIDGVTGGMEEA